MQQVYINIWEFYQLTGIDFVSLTIRGVASSELIGRQTAYLAQISLKY